MVSSLAEGVRRAESFHQAPPLSQHTRPRTPFHRDGHGADYTVVRFLLPYQEAVKHAWKPTYIREVWGVDTRRNAAGGDGSHVGDQPLRRVEADDVDTTVRTETHGHQALAEPAQEHQAQHDGRTRSKILIDITSIELRRQTDMCSPEREHDTFWEASYRVPGGQGRLPRVPPYFTSFSLFVDKENAWVFTSSLSYVDSGLHLPFHHIQAHLLTSVRLTTHLKHDYFELNQTWSILLWQIQPLHRDSPYKYDKLTSKKVGPSAVLLDYRESPILLRDESPYGPRPRIDRWHHTVHFADLRFVKEKYCIRCMCCMRCMPCMCYILCICSLLRAPYVMYALHVVSSNAIHYIPGTNTWGSPCSTQPRLAPSMENYRPSSPAQNVRSSTTSEWLLGPWIGSL